MFSPNSSFTSMTKALISVESAIAMSLCMRLALWAAKRFTYRPRTIGRSAADAGRTAVAGAVLAVAEPPLAEPPFAALTAMPAESLAIAPAAAAGVGVEVAGAADAWAVESDRLPAEEE